MHPQAAIERAREFFRTGATRTAEGRLRALHSLARALEAREAALLAALRDDLRRPDVESYTAEIGFVLRDARHAARRLRGWMRPAARRVPLLLWPAGAFVRPEPLGVTAILGPWNYPLQLVLSPLVGALAAGNCAVLKPSEFAPRTAAALDELVRAAFDPRQVTCIQGGPEVAEALVAAGPDHVLFTGSGATGRRVLAAAAARLTPVTLELGGKCPCLVCPDAAVETAARRIAAGKFLNAGQTCVAPDFVLVHRSVAADLVAALVRAVRAFYGENPRRSPSFGRIVNRRHFDRLAPLLADGSAACGGDRDADDLYVAPTVLTGVSWEAAIMREEIFGPILPVLEYERLDDALARLRAMPRPPALYLFTASRANEAAVLDACPSGGACVNDTVSQIFPPELPFGGVGESGTGSYRGKAGFDRFSHPRGVLRRSVRPDLPWRYPPYRATLSMLRRAYGWLMR
jgi:aldehyde dehydrogenase (NAD+)